MVAAVAHLPESTNQASEEPGNMHGWQFRRVSGTAEAGVTGLVRMGMDVYDEWYRPLRGSRGVRTYREIADNDSSVGASLNLMDLQVRQVRWFAEAADHPLGEEAAQHLRECIDDMSHSWTDFLSEVMSMCTYGWAWFNRVYKYREGPARDGSRSKYSDGKVGWRKFSIRSQETLDGWEFDEDGGIKGMWQVASPDYDRVFIPIEHSLLMRPRSPKNNPEGRSMLRNAHRPWFFLKRLEELEAIGIERDLVGLLKAELPHKWFLAGATPEQKQAIHTYARLVSQVRRNEQEGLTVPSEKDENDKPTGFKFTLMGVDGKRLIDPSIAITRHRQSIGQVLLTHFIFLGLDKVGTQALSMNLTSIFSVALSVLLDVIEETFQRYAVADLMELNGYPPEAWPKWKHGDVEKADIRPLAEALLKLVDSGLITPDSTLEEYIRNEARLPPIPEVDPDEEDDDEEEEQVIAQGSENAAATIVAISQAIEKLSGIGDADMVNALRNQLALMLGIPEPKALTADDIKPPPPTAVGPDGKPVKPGAPGAKPGATAKPKPKAGAGAR